MTNKIIRRQLRNAQNNQTRVRDILEMTLHLSKLHNLPPMHIEAIQDAIDDNEIILDKLDTIVRDLERTPTQHPN